MTPPGTIHATAVARDGAAVLLVGPSGAGKSDLALRLIDRGWNLVADDRVVPVRRGDALWLGAPAAIAGLLEVRGVGLVRLPYVVAPARLVVDLALAPARLPRPMTRAVAGVTLPLAALRPFEASAPLKVGRLLRRALDGWDDAAEGGMKGSGFAER